MKLRWKFFFILLVFGLVPLGVVTVASQRGIRWIGTVIAADVQQNSARLANSILKRTAENSATLLELNKKSFELALSRLVFEADAVLTEKPQGRRKVYPAADFDDPVATPRDAGLRPGYIKKLADGRSVNEVVSFEHPSVLFAPGVSPSKVVDDVDRLSLLTDTFAEIFAKLGHALHWIYVSSESGVHLSFPGHGGYPKGYDPRRFSWYLNATEEPRWRRPQVDATTGQLVMTVSKQLRHADGSRAGVAAMSVLLTEALRIDTLSSLWTADMQSLLVTPALNPQTQTSDLLIIAQKDYQTQASYWEEAIPQERLAAEDAGKMAQLVSEISNDRPGSLEMPYRGVPSIWAFAPIGPKAAFVLILPKKVTDLLPEKTLNEIRALTAEGLVFTTVTAIGMILLSFLAALTGSRNFTRRTYELVEAAGRLSRGDFNVCIDTRTGDERDQLIQAFNDMGPKLEDQLRVHESLRLATEVQQNLLPGKEPAVPGLDIAGISLYCDETGGDYYDFLTTATTPKAGTTVVIGDVSGHGAYSALLMASARAALRLRASLPGSAAEIVADVNRQFAEDVGDTGAFMTLFYLTVDGVRREARWVRAGHDPAIYYEPKSGRFEELGGHGAPLGVDEEVVFEEMEKDNLKPGGIIFIGTDGIWETTGREGRLFGKKALLRLIETHAHRSAHEIMQAVIRELEAFRKGIKPSDDITMVVIKLME